MTQVLMKGNEALAQAAINGGCTHFFGYPITPQNEIPEYFARELPRNGGVFLQAESELASIHMVYGAAAAGARVMTSSSSPGIALMQEGISLLAAAELPCVIVNVQRGGPGIGGIQPSQSDYYQMTRGGGNGDYRIPAFAPATIQESADMMLDAFGLADRYRSPIYIVSDGMLGQMMEPVEFKRKKKLPKTRKEWTVTGHGNTRDPHIVKTMSLDPVILAENNYHHQKKYDAMESELPRFELFQTNNAEIILTAYGSTSRITRDAIEMLNGDGIKAGLIRPLTLWPFPKKAFEDLDESTCKEILCVEMSCGQMVDDVKLSVNGRFPVSFLGRPGGIVPSPVEIVDTVKHMLGRS